MTYCALKIRIRILDHMYFTCYKTFETVDRNYISDNTVARNFVSLNSHRLSSPFDVPVIIVLINIRMYVFSKQNVLTS